MNGFLSEEEKMQITEAMEQVMRQMHPERKKKLHLLFNSYLELMNELDRIEQEVEQRMKINGSIFLRKKQNQRIKSK